jgi:hypothetical protein
MIFFILSKFKLKKVDQGTKTNGVRHNEELSSLLMRRVALEMSDSSDGNHSADEDW